MSSPLIDRLSQQFGYPVLDATTLDAFLEQEGASVLFFSEDPANYPEANDVAVILPELMSRFAGRARAAVIARAAEKALQPRFGVLQADQCGTHIGVDLQLLAGEQHRLLDFGERPLVPVA